MIVAKAGDSSERRHEERRLRVKAQRYEHIFALAVTKNGVCEQAALISAKNAEIRQIEPFAVRLAAAEINFFLAIVLALDGHL